MGAWPASSGLAFKPPAPHPPPPTAGKGTEGHRGTAEKTRHAPVQPLNTGATVKGPEKGTLLMVDACIWVCAEQTHPRKRECIHLCPKTRFTPVSTHVPACGVRKHSRSRSSRRWLCSTKQARLLLALPTGLPFSRFCCEVFSNERFKWSAVGRWACDTC